jgi:sugar phosphate isomerase/epimerase
MKSVKRQKYGSVSVASPQVYLTLDNCYAIKRWIRPSQWIPLAKELGFSSLEASTDNEFDPLFSTPEYRRDWIAEVKEYEQKCAVKVRSFYTGYQTYRTAGLAHPDPRVRRKLQDDWLKPLVLHAEELGADIGFYLHAIEEEALQDPVKYREVCVRTVKEIAEAAAFAAAHGEIKLCCEQMYAPYLTPWTVKGTKEFLKFIYASGYPVYTTVDLGHMVGQRKFTIPDKERILSALEVFRKGRRLRGQWFGPRTAYKKLKEQAEKSPDSDEIFVREFLAYLEPFEYLFAPLEDSDPYRWLKELGAWSPIIHMQQTDGFTSSHAPFIPETNAKGIIEGSKFFKALAESYNRPEEPGMPRYADSIVLVFEIFLGNVTYPYDGLENLKETLEYWRRFVPHDGMTLDAVIASL